MAEELKDIKMVTEDVKEEVTKPKKKRLRSIKDLNITLKNRYKGSTGTYLRSNQVRRSVNGQVVTQRKNNKHRYSTMEARPLCMCAKHMLWDYFEYTEAEQAFLESLNPDQVCRDEFKNIKAASKK